MIKEQFLIIITAPSGSGKTTIINQLLNRNQNFSFAISHTTRDMRKGEKHGREYYFITKSEFDEKKKNKDFLEWAEVHENYYGTSKEEILRLNKKKKKVILDIDVQGALELMAKKEQDFFLKQSLFIFIGVESENILRERLLQRATDSLETIGLRLKNSKKELALQKKWDNVVINNKVEQAVYKIEGLISKSFARS